MYRILSLLLKPPLVLVTPGAVLFCLKSQMFGILTFSGSLGFTAHYQHSHSRLMVLLVKSGQGILEHL